MKAKSALAAALVLISSVTFANGSNESKLVVVRVQDSGIFKVIFESENLVKSTVNVLNKKGSLVFTQEIEGKNGFILPMNFKGMMSGEYSIEVKSGSDTWTQTVSYLSNSKGNYSNHREKNSSIQNVHVLKLGNNGKYLLSIAKKGNDVIYINIFNAHGDLLYTETRKTDGDLAIVYNVKGLFGTPKFQITDNFGYSKVIRK